MTIWNESLRQEALRADHAWSIELLRLFGKNAGDVRYTAKGCGEEGSELRRLYIAFRLATDAWQETIKHNA